MSLPDYLALLHLDGQEVQGALNRIRDNVRASADPFQYIQRRFKYSDWRGHLISAVAMLLADDHYDLPVADLWSAFDAGSWVAPRCPVTMPEGLPGLERHVATGPTGRYERRCKALASLLALQTGRDSPALVSLFSPGVRLFFGRFDRRLGVFVIVAIRPGIWPMGAVDLS